MPIHNKGIAMKNWVVAASFMLVSLSAMAGLTPDQLVKKTADDVIDVIKNDKDIQAGNQQKIFDLAEEKILPNFDFEKVSRLVLGKNWTNASAEQKTAFQGEFKTLLLRTYATALSKYKNQVIEYKPFRMEAGADAATVKTAIQQPGGEPIGVDYTLSKKGEDWKVYDIVIEGVSLVTNYRSQFAQEIRQNGLDSLIKKLSDKNKAATGR